MTKQADFRKYYRDAHATNLLTDREKKLIGIAVAIVRNCQPWIDQRLADAGKEGISEEVLDTTFDLTTAVMAGIGQSMNQRYKKSHQSKKGWSVPHRDRNNVTAGTGQAC